MDKEINFKKELKELLKKYDATIDWMCDPCSDLYGVYDSKLVVTFWTSKYFKEESEHTLSEGDSICFEDL